MNKKGFVALLLTVLFSQFIAKAQDADTYAGIIPAPVSVKKAPGQFSLTKETNVFVDSITNKAVAFFADYMANYAGLSFRPQSNAGTPPVNSIILTSNGTEGLPAEGYRLTITPQNITIAGKGAGLFYGVQTLIQLMPVEHSANVKLPCVQVEDYPRFGYRGMMLDVARHFFSVEFVKKYIDLLAMYKLNNFHWHLADDQGWRIEIKQYPKLTEIGSKRQESLIGSYRVNGPYDGTPYGGYYTQEQIKEVVKYAADRYINIVPEIDIPGHSDAALTAYPEYGSNPPGSYHVSGTWSERNDVFLPTEQTFTFLDNILSEVMDLFPSKYIHIGGDEVAKDDWQHSSIAQQIMKKNKLKDENELQAYFEKRIEQFVNSKGRTVIGWDEILEGGVAPNAIIMSWRGEQGGIAAAKLSHYVIMTPSSNGLYFDHAQGKLGDEPLNIGNYAPLKKTYSYDPIPAVLTPDQQKYILGVQANLWTEYIATENKVEYMLLPRLLALSEIAWSPVANKNYEDFKDVRLPKQLAWLDAHGFDYRVPAVIGTRDTVIFGIQLPVNLKPSVQGASIYYTLDGYSPRETDLKYTAPFTYTVPADQSRELQAIVITPTGKRSDVVRTTVWNKTPLLPVPYQGNAAGLKYQLFTGTYDNTNQFSLSAPLDSTAQVVKSLNIAPFRRNTNFGVIFTGFIRIDADGVYGFSIQSDDGSTLAIDDIVIVDNDKRHALIEKGGSVPLQKGFHKFTLKYFNVGGGSNLHVYMTMPGRPKGELGPDILFN